MWIAELWRYPVKSMAGEKLQEAEVTPDGIAGDRAALVLRGDRVITARSHPRLLRHHAVLAPDGQPLVDGLPWDSPRALGPASDITHSATRAIRHSASARRVGDGWTPVRPNIVIGGAEGLVERQWEGKDLRIGAAVIRVRDLRERCVMTTYDPDTLEQDIDVLRQIVRDSGGSMALNCYVVEPSIVRIGEPVEVLAAQ
jgi:uncharacterized protein YcbX